MGVNKVLIGDEVKLDLTTDTVSENNLLVGATAHNAAGEPVTGAVVTTPVDSELSETSENAIQNKTVANALNDKAAASHTHTKSQITDFPASLPANGGNADYATNAGNANAFGGKNVSDFVLAMSGAQINDTRVLIPDNVDVIDWLIKNAKIGTVYFRINYSIGQTNLPSVTNISWAWFSYDGNRYFARVMISDYSTREFILDMVNLIGGWKEISTTPIKSTSFSVNSDEKGNFNLWSPSENKVPIFFKLDNKTFYAVPFLYKNQLWRGSTINEATRQPVANTNVSGIVYYINV